MVAVSRRCRSGFTLVELLVVIAIIGVLVALMLPAVQQARESARRTQCFNNLKQYGLAAQNFHQQYNRLPPYFSWGKTTVNPDGGWLLNLLPYLEQQPSYDLATAEGGGATRTQTVPASTDPPYRAAYSVSNGGRRVNDEPVPGATTNHMGHTYQENGSQPWHWEGPADTVIPQVGTAPQYRHNGLWQITDLNFSALHCPSDPSGIPANKRIAWQVNYGPYNSVGPPKLDWTTTNYQANFLAFVKDADKERMGVELPITGARAAVAPKMDAVMTYKDITDGTSNTILFGEGMRLCDGAYRFAMWNVYNARHSHNFGVDWNGKANTFMFQTQPHRTRCNNWRLQGLHFGTLAVCLVDGSVRNLKGDISRRETGSPDFPQVGVDAEFANSDPSKEFDGTWDRMMMPSDGEPLGKF